MRPSELVVTVAAAWRLTHLVTSDEVARPVREAVKRRWPGTRAAYLIECPKCVSVWASAAVLVAPKLATRVLAASAGVISVAWLGEAVEVALSNAARRT